MSERWVIVTSERREAPSWIRVIDLNTAIQWRYFTSLGSIVSKFESFNKEGEELLDHAAIYAMYQILQRARFDDAADHKAIDRAVELLKEAEQMLDHKNQRNRRRSDGRKSDQT